MTYKEIFNIEKRDASNLTKIHLIREGIWWRANEWSAYLCQHFPSELKENERLKPTKKNSKENNDGLIFVGLKLTSFGKFLPGLVMPKDFNFNEGEVLSIDVKDFFDKDFFADHETKLREWKNKFKVKRNNDRDNSGIISENYANDILKMILEYPMENHTIIENVGFLAKIKSIIYTNRKGLVANS